MAKKAQHDDSYEPIPTLLRGWREAAELSQRDLGAKLGKPQSWIYNCETGARRVDLAEFVAWCRACQLDPVLGLKRFLRTEP
jgi:transcriptional regulator with XRE-family HTH domain